jgi:hypothetical protein
VVATTAVWAGRQPDRLPTHWSGPATPDGFSPTWPMLRWALGACMPAAIAGVGAIAWFRNARVLSARWRAEHAEEEEPEKPRWATISIGVMHCGAG